MIAERSAAFFTTFICNLVHAYKFHGNLKTAKQFFKKLDNPEINHQFTLPPSFKDIEHKERQLNGALNVTNMPPRFCVYK